MKRREEGDIEKDIFNSKYIFIIYIIFNKRKRREYEGREGNRKDI